MAVLIDRYRTWITVQGIYRDDWFLFVSGGLLKRYANPVFNLIVKWPRGNKVRGQVMLTQVLPVVLDVWNQLPRM